MRNVFLQSSFVLLVTGLFGCHQARLASATHSSQEYLVVEGPIPSQSSRALLLVTIHGRAATLVLDLENASTLSLSPTALAGMGVTLADTTQLDSLTVGSVVEHRVPLRLTDDLSLVEAPRTFPPVVGIMGIHFLDRYDLVYDLPAHRVQVYRFPARRADTGWLPPGVQPTDCSPMLPVSTDLQYPPFTAMVLQLEGHSVTGVLEMGRYRPKMNQTAANVLGLTKNSPNVRPLDEERLDLFGNPVDYKADGIRLAIGTNVFWTGTVELYQKLGVDDKLPPQTPVMLMNLVHLDHLVLFNLRSSGQVCLSTPKA